MPSRLQLRTAIGAVAGDCQEASSSMNELDPSNPLCLSNLAIGKDLDSSISGVSALVR